MWFKESIFYQIYPLGFCGAPYENDGIEGSRIEKIVDWIPHMKKIGVDAVYLAPLFESDSHGYDTRDYTKIDCRLGNNEDFKRVCEALHKNDIRIVLDGVFHHVGRGFWAFQDVITNREKSPYLEWFFIDLEKDSNYQDGLWYEGWEGHYELVKLNVENREVRSYLLMCVQDWMQEFDIDGLRLDVAYLLDHEFMKRLHLVTKSVREDFFLLGEMIHGDYNQIVKEEMLDSATNYECYKGLYSSFNTYNFYEIAHSLNRQFGAEDWTLYKGKHLFAFVDNHDTDRIASKLEEPKHLPLLYGLLYGMPGIPCIYYGSEWGIEGEKGKDNDYDLRPYFDKPEENSLSEFLGQLSHLYKNEKTLQYGDYRQVYIQNRQFIFARTYEAETLYVGLNCDADMHRAAVGELHFQGKELLSGKDLTFEGMVELPPYSVSFWKEVK